MKQTMNLTEQARWDIDEIARYIELDNPSASRRFAEALLETFHFIKLFPFAAPLHQAVRPGLLGIRKKAVSGFKAYLIVYHVRDDQSIDVLRILHGARQLPEDWI